MEKKPICNYSGEMKELQPGDTLPGSGGAALYLMRTTSFSTTSVTFVDITGMQITFAANKKFRVNVYMSLSGGGGSNDVQARLDLTSGTMDGTQVYTLTSTATMNIINSAASLTTVAASSTLYFDSNFILSTGASGSTLKLQIKNNGTGLSNVSCDKCYITAFEVQ